MGGGVGGVVVVVGVVVGAVVVAGVVTFGSDFIFGVLGSFFIFLSVLALEAGFNITLTFFFFFKGAFSSPVVALVEFGPFNKPFSGFLISRKSAFIEGKGEEFVLSSLSRGKKIS